MRRLMSSAFLNLRDLVIFLSICNAACTDVLRTPICLALELQLAHSLKHSIPLTFLTWTDSAVLSSNYILMHSGILRIPILQYRQDYGDCNNNVPPASLNSKMWTRKELSLSPSSIQDLELSTFWTSVKSKIWRK